MPATGPGEGQRRSMGGRPPEGKRQPGSFVKQPVWPDGRARASLLSDRLRRFVQLSLRGRTRDGLPPYPRCLSACRGQHWTGGYGASACAALAKTVRRGWLDASITRTRRVLRTMAEAILSNCTRMVAVQAWDSTVPARAWRRRLISACRPAPPAAPTGSSRCQAAVNVAHFLAQLVKNRRGGTTTVRIRPGSRLKNLEATST